MKEPTEIMFRRARLRADGLDWETMAEMEGVRIGSIRGSVESLIRKASNRGVPGSWVPGHGRWLTREDGSSYVTWSHPNKDANPAIVQWALGVLEKPTACPACGRPY